MGVLVRRALLFAVYIGAPDCWKLPYEGDRNSYSQPSSSKMESASEELLDQASYWVGLRRICYRALVARLSVNKPDGSRKLTVSHAGEYKMLPSACIYMVPHH